MRCYGYRRDENDRYEIVPEEAEVVREVFRRRIAGEAINHIASDLAERGVLTYTGRPCSYGMVYNMVHNEKYLGIYEWGGIRQEDGMPRIIDDDTFYRAQHVQGKKQRKNEHWGDFRAIRPRHMLGVRPQHARRVGTRLEGREVRVTTSAPTARDVKPVRRDWLEAETVRALREMSESREKAVEIAHLLLDGQNDAEVEKRVASKRATRR
ncbi:MAG: recombinase family protein [Collinsella sp.]